MSIPQRLRQCSGMIPEVAAALVQFRGASGRQSPSRSGWRTEPGSPATSVPIDDPGSWEGTCPRCDGRPVALAYRNRPSLASSPRGESPLAAGRRAPRRKLCRSRFAVGPTLFAPLRRHVWKGGSK
jgi:hypothetical protein